jgi:hypothetical protein
MQMNLDDSMSTKAAESVDMGNENGWESVQRSEGVGQ